MSVPSPGSSPSTHGPGNGPGNGEGPGSGGSASSGSRAGADPRGGPGAGDGAERVEVLVNGEQRHLPAGTTVADVVAALVPSARGVAVAVDREVVPRSSWAATVLMPGARVEVVTAAAGG